MKRRTFVELAEYALVLVAKDYQTPADEIGIPASNASAEFR